LATTEQPTEQPTSATRTSSASRTKATKPTKGCSDPWVYPSCGRTKSADGGTRQC
jgi:hypothetical protein